MMGTTIVLVLMAAFILCMRFYPTPLAIGGLCMILWVQCVIAMLYVAVQLGPP